MPPRTFIHTSIHFPTRYVPLQLTKRDQKKQLQMLLHSKKQYKKQQYFTRKRVASYRPKKSNHISNARKLYSVKNIAPTPELAEKTGCTVAALQAIVRKGEGAYYSSGSRPNQTPQSWGLARLASAITAGKAAAVDYTILEKGCQHNKKAFRLAKTSRKNYTFGHSKTKQRTFKI